MTKNSTRAIDVILREGWSEIAAFALVGGFQVEAGPNLNTKAYYEKEASYGIGQWRKDRLARLKRFAKEHKKPVDDLETQVLFALWELKNKESRAGNWLRKAETLEQAASAAVAFERPARYRTPPANSDWGRIMRAARKALAFDQRFANAFRLRREWEQTHAT